MGSVYRRRTRNGRSGAVFWVNYYVNGLPIREGARTGKETEARRFLKEREGRVVTGHPILTASDMKTQGCTTSRLAAPHRRRIEPLLGAWPAEWPHGRGPSVYAFKADDLGVLYVGKASVGEGTVGARLKRPFRGDGFDNRCSDRRDGEGTMIAAIYARKSTSERRP